MEIFALPPVGVDGVPVGGEVVGHNVDDDADAMRVGCRGHGFQVVFAADHEVADGGVRRLIHVIPIFGEFLAVGVVHLDFAHRLGLNGGVTGFGDLIHMFGDGVERPHPRVQNGAVLHLLGQTVLFACCVESRVAYGVRITVTVGARLCGDAGDCQSAENCGKGCGAHRQLLADAQTQLLPGGSWFPMFH